MMNTESLNTDLSEVKGFFGGVSSYTSAMEVLKIRFERPEPETEYELTCASCTYFGVPTAWDNVDLTATLLDSRGEHVVISDEMAKVKIICREASLSKLI